MSSKNMMKFYEEIRNVNPNRKNVVMTVLDYGYAGEKVLISDGRIVWKSCENGFFSEKEISNIEENGIVRIGGCRVFCEILGREKKLVICGGGHVSMPIITIGRMLGFSVTVLEDRPEFAGRAEKQGAAEVICAPFEEGLKKIEGDQDTFFIIVTRGHRYDQLCLELIIKKKHAYIGMMGSRRKVEIVKRALLDKGEDPEVVKRVFSPIGLDIKAETPEEIAVAVLAEIIQVKNEKKRNCGYSKELLQNILETADAEGEDRFSKVLATIIMRKGSAPRQIGTKMLIFPDGKISGTIGGGSVEAEVMQEGIRMLRKGERGAKLCHVDMTAAAAEEEGMVCGGVIDVLLEVI